jgi:hypothetical protein
MPNSARPSTIPPPLPRRTTGDRPSILPASAKAPHVTIVQEPIVQGYRAEPDRARGVYLAALGWLSLVILQVAPLMGRWNPATSSDWARGLMFVALLQFAYIGWMVSVPDWATMRVAMFILAGVATVYGVVLGIAVRTPLYFSLPLGMDEVRGTISLWCFAAILLAAAMSCVCGRLASQWRDSFGPDS